MKLNKSQHINLLRKSNIYYLIWLLLLFTSFEGFGLRSPSWGGLGGDSLGWFGILQLLALLLTLIVPILFKPNMFFNLRLRMGPPALLMILLLVVILLQSLLGSLISKDVTVKDIFSNLVKMKYILIYFVFIYLLSRPNGIKIAMQSIIVASIFSSIVAIIIVLFEQGNSAIELSTTNQVGREFRVIIPTAMLISFSFVYLLSKFLLQREVMYLIASLICFVPILLQMHRGVLISIVIVVSFVIFKLHLLNFKRLSFFLLFICVSSFVIILTFKQINYTGSQLIENISSTKEEILNKSGNFGVRFFLVINSLKYVIDNYLILGVGLNWQKVTNFSIYFENKFVAGPTFDSGYNNIVIVYGLLGIIVYIFLFYRLFKTINSLIEILKNTEYISMVYGLLFSLIYVLLTSISSDNFLLYNSTFIFTFIISTTYILERKIKNEEIG